MSDPETATPNQPSTGDGKASPAPAAATKGPMLAACPERSAGQRGHPGLAQPAPPVHEPDLHEGHDEGQQRCLAAHHGGHGVQRQPGRMRDCASA
ncbi:hypothetical protein GCM10027072_71760 [Streptomyces bullii]